MRLSILVLLTFTSLSQRSYALNDDEILCHRAVDAKTELTTREYNFLLGKAQRLHHQIQGEWGKFLGFRQALYYGGELHVVASFMDGLRLFEIVIVYDPKMGRIVMLLAPDESGKGIQAYEDKPAARN